MCRRTTPAVVCAILVTLPMLGCDQGVINRVENELASLVQDPLGLEPYPVLIGGNDVNVFYATNLTDIPFRVPGFKNEVVIPGPGPSNVYAFTREKPELIRPLGPASWPYVRQMTTDGRFLAYVGSTTDADGAQSAAVLVEELSVAILDRVPIPTVPTIVYEFAPDGPNYPGDLLIDAGRLAIVREGNPPEPTSVRIIDLLGGTATIDIEIGEFPWAVDLRGNRLAWISSTNRVLSAHVHDFVTGESVVLSDPLVDTFWPNSANILLTANSVIWSEGAAQDVSRVWRYHFPTGEKRVWTDAVQGDLVGATDAFLITQEAVWRDNVLVTGDSADLIVIRRYDTGGKAKQLAEFRSQNLAGQARVLGNRAVFVNDRRDVVIAPLDGGDRRSFKPF